MRKHKHTWVSGKTIAPGNVKHYHRFHTDKFCKESKVHQLFRSEDPQIQITSDETRQKLRMNADV